MARSRPVQASSAEAVAAYKQLLADVLARRPSGTRQRLATILGKNRSFISQITNPAYDTPLPPAHVGPLLDACHVSAAERQAFLALYAAAHPRHFTVLEGGAAFDDGPKKIAHTIYLPDFGSPSANRAALKLVADFVNNLAGLVQQAATPGGPDEETDE